MATEWTNRNVVPYYKGTWANIRRVGGSTEYKHNVSFNRRRYDTA